MRRAGVLLAVCLLAAVPLLAAEAAEGVGTVEEPGRFLGLPHWVFWTLNLVIFLGILVYFAGPAVVQFLEGKQRDVRHALEEAQRHREEAGQMEARLTAQVAELRREVEELASRSEREGERERQQILADAERDRERLAEATRGEIAHQLRQAQQELSQHAVALATRLAEERIRGSLTAEDRRRLFAANLGRLERR
ncbi:MAG TPA: hypothetical protein VMT16_14795 [Thermoanaerobaculia bacterium]|nr:hypothetical protein [Thermoanaerobaculia bacterium]